MKTTTIQFRIDEELKNRFDAICEQKFINGSAMIRGWIENYVKEEDEKCQEKNKS